MTTTLQAKKKDDKTTPRHKKVAEDFQKWLEENPKASKIKRLKKFDEISDEAYGR